MLLVNLMMLLLCTNCWRAYRNRPTWTVKMVFPLWNFGWLDRRLFCRLLDDGPSMKQVTPSWTPVTIWFTWSRSKITEWRNLLIEVPTSVWKTFWERSSLNSWFFLSHFWEISWAIPGCTPATRGFGIKSSKFDRELRIHALVLPNFCDFFFTHQHFVFFLRLGLGSLLSLQGDLCPVASCF